MSSPQSIVTNEDNMIGMDRYPDKHFDLASDDPPYFTGPEKRGFYGKKQSSIGVQRIYKNTVKWSVPGAAYFEEVKRVSLNQIIWGANYYDFIGLPHKTPRRHEISAWLELHPVGWIVWDKCNGTSSFNDYELAWTSFDRPTIIYKFMWNGMLQGSGVFTGEIMQGNKKLNQKRIHPTEKPIPLYKWCFNEYCKHGETILSNYVGSGSDRIAALDLGYDFTGFEIDPDHYKDQEKRYKLIQQQTTLF